MKNKQKKILKNKCQIFYGFIPNSIELKRMINTIKGKNLNKSAICLTESNKKTVQHWIVEHRFGPIYCIYNKEKEEIVNFLPIEDLEKNKRYFKKLELF